MKTFLILLIGISCAFAAYDACNYLNDCWQCTQISGCAWCESGVGVCMSNTSLSNCRAVSQNNNANFVLTTANCVNTFPNCTAKYPTDDNSTCNACIADSACGWCYTNGLGGTCRGNGFGTVGCTYAQGVWLQNAGDGSCPASDSLTCRSYTSCSSCNANALCGWCQAPSYDRNCFEIGGNATKAQFSCTNPTTGFGGIWQYPSGCATYPTCPVSGQAARGNPITYCTSQANVGCCNVSMDSSINSAVSAATLTFGSTCSNNFKTLFCTGMCDSGMGAWANSTTVRVESDYADRMYCNCVTTAALKTTYPNRASFFTALSASTSLTFTITSTGFNQTSPQACAVPTTTAPNSSAMMMTPLFALFAICLILCALLQ